MSSRCLVAIGLVASTLTIVTGCNRSSGPTYITGSGISDTGYLCVKAEGSLWRSVDTIVPTPASVKSVDGRFTRTSENNGQFDLGPGGFESGRRIELKRSEPTCP